MIAAVRGELLRYKALAEGAMAQLTDDQLLEVPAGGSNSIAIVCQHVAGNLRSRFTDFLTSDGEKPWRNRDEEFAPRPSRRDEILQDWESGWRVLLSTLDALSDADLERTVTIRRQPMTVTEALLRALAHVSYHAGQIVFVAKTMRAAAWTSLSIPPGGTATYNAAPDRERPPSGPAAPTPGSKVTS